MRSSRIAAAAAALLLSIAAFAGCAASPGDVTATPTPMFASDEEAFAAAEATYRAYLDEVNRNRESSGADPQAVLVGRALEADIAGVRKLKSAGIHVVGPSALHSFAPQTRASGLAAETMTAVVCLDASQAIVVDAAGQDVTPPERQAIAAFDVVFVVAGSALLISESNTSTATC